MICQMAISSGQFHGRDGGHHAEGLAVHFVAAGVVLEGHFHRQVEAGRHLGPHLAAPQLEARTRHLVGADAAERLALFARDPLGQVGRVLP
jgi:hypothetical protein